MPQETKKTVWVGGLPHDIKEDRLVDVFSRCGRVVEAQIRHSPIDTFAFVTFADDRGYEKALSTMDQSKHFGSPMKVNVVIQRDNNAAGRRPPGRDGGKGGPPRRGDSRDRRGGGGGGRRDFRDDHDDHGPPRLERGDSYDRRGPPPRRGDSRDRRGAGGPPRRGDSYDRRGGGGRERQDGRDDRGPPRPTRDSSRDGGRWRDDRRDERDRPRSTAAPPGYRDRDRGGDGRGGGRDDDRRPRSMERDRSRGRDRPPRYDSPRPEDRLSSGRLWVGGMPKNVTDRDIEKVFSKHGPLSDVIIRHSDIDTFGFVQFRDPGHAYHAMQDLNQSERFGGVIKVAPAGGKSKAKGDGKGFRKGDGRDDRGRRSPSGRRYRSRSPYRGPMNRGRRSRSGRPQRGGGSSVRYCVKLGNLPPDMDAEELLEFGSVYGRVVFHDVWSEARNQSNAGVLEYGVFDEARKALDDLNERRIDGWDKRISASFEHRDG